MKVLAAAATDIGRVREGNEDSYLTDDPLFAVADGMGGHRGGEVASKLALETVEHLFGRGRGGLADTVQEANRVVFERSILDRRLAGMGTTLTAAVMEGDRVRLAHIGDSRAYLLRGGELRLMTEDHTLVNEMVESGEITREEADAHPYRSVLTRALGTEATVQIDEGLVEVREGDRLLLCTDGLTGMVTEEQIGAILEAATDPKDAADRLVRAANRAGGIDNITAVVLDFVADDPADQEGAGAGLRMPDHAQPRSAPPRTAGARRPSPKRLALGIGVPLVVVVSSLAGLRLYLDSQWYVGVSNGRVAIFRGIPAEVAGFDLHRVVVVTPLSAADAESLAVYEDLEDGITAGDRAEADAIVEQIRADLAGLPAVGGP